MKGKGTKQKITLSNEARGTVHTLLIDRRTGRLSHRQERETFLSLSVPGFHQAGALGEWPLNQHPPEVNGEAYCVIRMGEPDDSRSDLYFVPVESAAHLIEKSGATRPVAIEKVTGETSADLTEENLQSEPEKEAA